MFHYCYEFQQDIPENILQNGTDDFQTMASKQYENTEAQEGNAHTYLVRSLIRGLKHGDRYFSQIEQHSMIPYGFHVDFQ